MSSFDDVRNFLSRNHRVNVDGCGVSFFLPDGPESDKLILGQFRTTQPINNCENLKSLCRVVWSKRFFAHIRATSGSAVAECNTHPFVFCPSLQGCITFMHNGSVARFKNVQRQLCSCLSEAAFSQIRGTCDSELLGALCWDFLTATFGPGPYSGAELAASLQHTIGMVISAVDAWSEANGVASEAKSSLNMAICSSRAVAVTRFRNGGEDPPTLFFQLGHGVEEQDHQIPAHQCSFRLTKLDEERKTSKILFFFFFFWLIFIFVSKGNRKGSHLIVASEPFLNKVQRNLQGFFCLCVEKRRLGIAFLANLVCILIPMTTFLKHLK